ncbi:hypothetical protein QTP88_008640 [Uroleucon formosanum]
MSEKSFKNIKAKLLECSKLPEPIKDILKITNNNSLKDLDENNFNQLWILTHDFIKENTLVENITQDAELFLCYQSVLNLVNFTITCADDDIITVCENDCLLKTILVFQTFYSTNLKYKFKLDIIKMCCSFWQLVTSITTQNGSDNIYNFDLILTQNFVFTFNYIFDTIKVTTKKTDMKVLSNLLWEFCKVVSNLSSNINGLNLVVPNLKTLMKCPLFLETEPGKLAIADIFTCSQQLFLKFHQTVKQNIPKANRSEAEAYGEIYFMAWINSNSSIREVIEEQIFDLISKTLTLRRTGLAFYAYRNALILLQSMQNHRKHLMFSKVITKLYAPVIWRQLTSEFSVVRCNATDILARAYPLEKRGEGREVSSRFLMKQQNAFLDLLVDVCPQVRIAAIKGICSCMRYFWNSFEDDQIIECFKLFIRLIDESVFEVRRVLLYGFCQLLDESKSHSYFKNPFLIAKMKNTLIDENEKVRRSFIHFLLKIKKIDSHTDTKDKINFTKIVDLRDIAFSLAREDKQNGLLLVDLIFDNFIGIKVPDKHTTLRRFYTFYKINPSAFRKLIIYSEKHLDFNSACKLILSLLKTVYSALKKKEERMKNIDKENDMPPKRHKSNDDSDTSNDTHNSSCNSSSVSNNDDEEQNEHNNICCILDCVNCLMILHCNEFKDEEARQQIKDIQDSSITCLIKIFKFYKEGDAYYSAISLAGLMPVTKLSAHVSITSTALSTLKQLPYDINQAEEEIDMRKVSCLVYSLCMWKRGYEILQFVNVWFDEAFKTLNLNETQYPDSKIDKGKRVRFKINFSECKPMTGILLINSMLTNLQTQKTLTDSDVNKKNIYDLLLYLQRVKAAIENRISSDNVLSNLLSDEVLIELFLLHNRLHIIYYSQEKDIDEIIKYQTSILDWVINNLLIYNLQHKDETTITFAVKIIEIVNKMSLNMCLMAFVNTTYLDDYITFCATVLHNHLGPWLLTSMMATLAHVSKYFNYLKLTEKLLNDTSILTNCVCSIISVLSESKYNADRFISVIGDPKIFRTNLIMLILEIYKTNTVEFKQVFMTLIETIMNIIANQIREIDEIDLNEHLTEMPFASYQLASVVLNNAKLRKHFSSNAVEIFSSNVFKNDCVLLLSAISYVYTLSFQLSKTIKIDLEPVVKILYKTLMEHDKTRTPLGDNFTINNTNVDRGVSILETSDFSNEVTNFRQKGRNVLIATAKQLHVTLSE